VSDDWLRATSEQETPDLVPHIIPLLHLRPAGQLIAFAEPGYSFKAEHSGHGGIHRTEMLMTFMMTGPGIEPGSSIGLARSVDILPTILALLGHEPSDVTHLEGRDLSEYIMVPERRHDDSLVLEHAEVQ
jgi:hypothetical protein